MQRSLPEKMYGKLLLAMKLKLDENIHIENAMGNMGMTVNHLESYPFRKQSQATVPVMVTSMFRVRGRLS